MPPLPHTTTFDTGLVMQLSRLIARLTADERSALLERRLGPKAVGIDDRMLGDRLAPGLRDDYLRELRLFGLADYDPKADGGYFATYPAVATVLSTTRGA